MCKVHNVGLRYIKQDKPVSRGTFPLNDEVRYCLYVQYGMYIMDPTLEGKLYSPHSSE